jgi:hypothetical protein
MVWLLFCFLIQDCRGFELLGVVLVVEIDRAVECKRIEDCRLGIVRVVLVQPIHRLLIMFSTGLVIDLVVIRVENLDRGQVLGLAQRLGFRCFALLDRFRTGLEVGGRKGRHQRIG